MQCQWCFLFMLSLIIHFLTALIQDLEMNKGEEMNLKTTLRLFTVATLLTMIGMGIMIIAFIISTYAVLKLSWELVISVAPDIAAALKFFKSLERTDFWHPVLWWEYSLFKESSPSIMVTRNPNWSTKILWFGTGYVKGKILSPLKRPAWGRLHC